MKSREEILNKINEMLEEEIKDGEECEEKRIRWEREGKKEKAEYMRKRVSQHIKGYAVLKSLLKFAKED